MAQNDFGNTETQTPTTIGRIEWTVTDPDGVNANRTIDGTAQVVSATGQTMGHIKADDLTPQLTTTEKQQLAGIADKFRALAVVKLP